MGILLLHKREGEREGDPKRRKRNGGRRQG